ncbi:Helix-turn-helix domain protein [Paenibacillus larvae subsp. larvae DSM 25430]|uniref:helix-turn-helix transcriptional regulator n=1 Tax=Paenibacillus larvae TaxID=1464 RepID=UPI0009B8C220|nr:Helix-turn-helix domain protein [Paenibacillus larvae subsp. larvae DSM 25430]
MLNNLEKKQMGLRIKKLREEKGLTQDELAEMLKMKNRATVSSYGSSPNLCVNSLS